MSDEISSLLLTRLGHSEVQATKGVERILGISA